MYRSSIFNSEQLSVISEQLAVKYESETPHQLMEDVFWRLFIPYHTPWLTDN